MAFVLVPKYYSTKTGTTMVVRANEVIEEGTIITDDMLISTEAGAFGLTSKVAVNADDVIGKVATGTIYKGETIWLERLVDKDAYAKAHEAKKEEARAPAGTKLLTLAGSDEAEALAGVMRSGVTVDFYAVTEDEDRNIITELKYPGMVVWKAYNSSYEELNYEKQIDENGKESRVSTGSLEPSFLVLCVTDEQAAYIIKLCHDGNYYLVFDKGDTTTVITAPKTDGVKLDTPEQVQEDAE